jgi:hypothetical protein
MLRTPTAPLNPEERMPPTTSPTDLVTQFRRLVRRLQTIEDELMARGESLLELALQSSNAMPSARTASLLRRMEVIDAELVVIERLLPEDFIEKFEEGDAAPPSRNLDVGVGPLDLDAR